MSRAVFFLLLGALLCAAVQGDPRRAWVALTLPNVITPSASR